MKFNSFTVADFMTSGAVSFAVLSAGCHSMPIQHDARNSIEVIRFEELPTVERTELHLGGFSGLVFEGFSSLSGEYTFTTTTNRGPTLDLRNDAGSSELRPFIDPTFAPRWARFSYKAEKHRLSELDTVLLTAPERSPLNGLPNVANSGVANLDETAINKSGRRVANDKMGIDPQGLAKDADSTYWISEGYRPSLLHFDQHARLLQRWIPKDIATGGGTPQLPHWYARHLRGRGFSGVAIDGDHVVAFLRSPLKDDFDVTRILSVDKKTGVPDSEYVYAFEASEEGRAFVDKIGDAARTGPGRFLVLEENSADDERGFHRIYEVDTNEASNISRLNGAPLSRSVLCAEGTPASEGALRCVTPVKKKLIADLEALGLRGFEKVEGLALIDAQTLALITDNGFDVGMNGQSTGFIIVHLKDALQLK